MKKTDFTERIKKAYSEEAPDILWRLEKCLPPKKEEVRVRRIRYGKLVLIAAVVILAAASFLFTVSFFKRGDTSSDSTDFTVEPVVEPIYAATADGTDEWKIDPSIDPEVLPYLLIDNGFTADYNIPTDIESLYENANLVIKAEYSREISTVFDGTTPYPVTTAEVEVIDVLKGEFTSKNAEIEHYGGIISLWDFTSKLSEERIKKYGFDDMNEEEMKEKFIGFEGAVNAEKGKTYLIFLSYDPETETYFVMCDSYGMRLMNSDGMAWNKDNGCYESTEMIE